MQWWNRFHQFNKSCKPRRLIEMLTTKTTNNNSLKTWGYVKVLETWNRRAMKGRNSSINILSNFSLNINRVAKSILMRLAKWKLNNWKRKQLKVQRRLQILLDQGLVSTKFTCSTMIKTCRGSKLKIYNNVPPKIKKTLSIWKQSLTYRIKKSTESRWKMRTWNTLLSKTKLKTNGLRKKSSFSFKNWLTNLMCRLDKLPRELNKRKL